MSISGGSNVPAEQTVENDDCCENDKPDQTGSKLKAIFSYGFIALPRDIGKVLLFGLVISAVITVFVPDDFFAGRLGTGLTGMILMMLIAIPMYVCATASVPIALSLIIKGVSPGAAVVFLMTGPATNAATIAMIWKVMGKRTVVIYLSTMALCALGGGVILDLLVDRSDVTSMTMGGSMLPSRAKLASAVILAGVLAFAVLAPILGRKHKVVGCDECCDGESADKIL